MTVLHKETPAPTAKAILKLVAVSDRGELEIEDLAGLYEKLPDAEALIREAGASGKVLITAGGISLNGAAWDRAHPED